MITDHILDDAIDQFHDEGYTIIKNFLPAEEVVVLQSKVAELREIALTHPVTFRHGNLVYEILPEEFFGKRFVIQAYWFAWQDSYFDKFRSNRRYLQLLQPLLGNNIKQVTQQIHWKPPGATLTGYRFHQDLRFRESRDSYENIVRDTITTGLAIDKATPENGCLKIVPRSHTMGYLGLSDNGDGQIMKGLTQDDELVQVGIDPAKVIDVVLEPGDLAVWGLMTVHGSLPNDSQHERAFAISSYVRGETSQRGEWTFKDGEPQLLGPTPQLCKNEKLMNNLEPHYDPTKWFL